MWRDFVCALSTETEHINWNCMYKYVRNRLSGRAQEMFARILEDHLGAAKWLTKNTTRRTLGCTGYALTSNKATWWGLRIYIYIYIHSAIWYRINTKNRNHNCSTRYGSYSSICWHLLTLCPQTYGPCWVAVKICKVWGDLRLLKEKTFQVA